jgi:hypothetical protein
MHPVKLQNFRRDRPGEDFIDAMALNDLVRYFADLWYPGPDDIDILDASLSWILAVGHDGEVKLVQLPGRDRK